ncbi:hypothetical protein GOV09_06985 [Candidatus Woesearchaeota archaeon]|nr:hypothetical protein [Candidatus Woesearchaeota archaeon]
MEYSHLTEPDGINLCERLAKEFFTKSLAHSREGQAYESFVSLLYARGFASIIPNPILWDNITTFERILTRKGAFDSDLASEHRETIAAHCRSQLHHETNQYRFQDFGIVSAYFNQDMF